MWEIDSKTQENLSEIKQNIAFCEQPWSSGPYGNVSKETVACGGRVRVRQYESCDTAAIDREVLRSICELPRRIDPPWEKLMGVGNPQI